MGLIYMRTSPSGGQYIGKTKFTEEERWKKHIQEALNPSSYGYNTLLNKAIRKYGAENFSVKILEDDLSDKLLSDREIYWIDYYKTFYQDNNHGYNMTRGGDGHQLLDINDDELIAKWNTGVSINEVANYFNCERQAIRSRLLSIGITSKDLRRRTGEIISQVRFEQIDQDDIKEIIYLWEQGYSLTKISTTLPYDRHTISRILQKSNILAEEINNRQTSYMIKATQKPILQYDKKNNLIQEWPSISDAARKLNLHSSNICKVLKGERKTTGGFVFKYKT